MWKGKLTLSIPDSQIYAGKIQHAQQFQHQKLLIRC